MKGFKLPLQGMASCNSSGLSRCHACGELLHKGLTSGTILGHNGCHGHHGLRCSWVAKELRSPSHTKHTASEDKTKRPLLISANNFFDFSWTCRRFSWDSLLRSNTVNDYSAPRTLLLATQRMTWEMAKDNINLVSLMFQCYTMAGEVSSRFIKA